MTEQSQVQIGMPSTWLAELIEEIDIQNSDAINKYTFLSEQDEVLDKTGLHLMIGEEEVNWAKLLFDSSVSAGICVSLQLVVDAIKQVYMKHVAKGHNTPEFIEYILPDGKRVRIYGKDLDRVKED